MEESGYNPNIQSTTGEICSDNLYLESSSVSTSMIELIKNVSIEIPIDNPLP